MLHWATPHDARSKPFGAAPPAARRLMAEAEFRMEIQVTCTLAPPCRGRRHIGIVEPRRPQTKVHDFLTQFYIKFAIENHQQRAPQIQLPPPHDSFHQQPYHQHHISQLICWFSIFIYHWALPIQYNHWKTAHSLLKFATCPMSMSSLRGGHYQLISLTAIGNRCAVLNLKNRPENGCRQE